MNISVVMATYKRPELLRRCLQALLAQQLDSNDYEILVVSDGPDAEAKEVVAQMHAVNLRYYVLPQKKGPAACRNFGWQQANGTLIAFTDDDTIPAPGWLHNIWQEFKEEECMAYTGRIIVPLSKRPTDYEWNTAQLEKADFVTANCACTKKALEKVQGFDERFEAAWREDSDLQFKLLQAGVPVVHLPDAVIVHPVRKAAWGASLSEQRKSMYNALLYKKYPLLYRQKIQAKPAWTYYAIIGCCLSGVIALLLHCYWVSFAVLLLWMGLVLSFAARRLAKTSRALSHVAEMLVTSFIIPFLSVYWTLYGARKFRVLFF